jgi:hypothetical protein
MKETLEVPNRMVADRVIAQYAIAGAVATCNYIEATVTDDLDILIAVEVLEEQPQLRSTLAERGYTEWRDEGIVIGGWPVQFLPVASELDAEALDHALDEVIRVGQEDEVRTRILRPEHLVAIALKKKLFSHLNFSRPVPCIPRLSAPSWIGMAFDSFGKNAVIARDFRPVRVRFAPG